MLHHLKRTERTAELLAFPGVGDGELDGGVQCADDLHAACPGAAPLQLSRGALDGGESTWRQVCDHGVAGLATAVVPPGN